MNRLDAHEIMPSGMSEYLSLYGWHFSKKLCEHAVSKMTKADGSKHAASAKEDVDVLLTKHGIEVTNNEGYDACYVYNMAKSDFFGTSLPNEQYVAMYVKDYLDDPDGYKGIALTRYYADCIGRGTPLFWEEYI